MKIWVYIKKIFHALLLVTFTLIIGCSSLFFYPKKDFVDNLTASKFNPEDIYFRTLDGLKLHGWLFKAKEDRGTILVLHGNAENISTHVNSVLWLVKEGFNVFIFDYRGYGKSEGEPNIPGIHRDAEAALETLINLHRINNNNVIILGQSLGGAVSVYLVANSPYKQRIKALVIDSVFSSYRRIMREKLSKIFITWPFQYPLSLFIDDQYSPEKWIKKVTPIPILIFHGEKDTIVPIHHGVFLYETAFEPKKFHKTTTPGHIMSFSEESARKYFLSYVWDILNNP